MSRRSAASCRTPVSDGTAVQRPLPSHHATSPMTSASTSTSVIHSENTRRLRRRARRARPGGDRRVDVAFEQAGAAAHRRRVRVGQRGLLLDRLRRRRGHRHLRHLQHRGERAQLGQHRGGVGRAGLGFAPGGALHERVQLGRHVARDLRRGRDVAGDVPVGHRDRRVAGVRRRAGEQLVEQDARRVDVAAGVGRAGGDLLGRQVRDRAQDRARVAGARLRRRDREPEVGDLRLPGLGDQHVLRLDVAVHDPEPVRLGEPGEHLLHDGERRGHAEGAAGAQHVAQRAAVDQLHDEEQPVADRRPGRGRRPRRGGRCGPPSGPPARSGCGTPGRPRTGRP